MPPPSNVLLCTVGTGDVDKLRETLLEPLKKSIRKGEWTQVILLPSRLTADNAARLRDELHDVPILARPLPRDKDEDDADACFAHFDGILDELRSAGTPPGAILADFTRGTKAMSAALVLAAVRHDLPQLRYITGPRDARGTVLPGAESIVEVHTTVATAQKQLDNAWRFFRHGNFTAVLETLPDPTGPAAATWPPDALAMAAFARPLAAFCAAWDRLDYRAAHAVVLPAVPRPSRWAAFQPAPEVRTWVADLAKVFPEGPAERAARLRLLVADLLANGERRLRDQQYEDSVIRAYRVLELVGQIRLFARGYDSASLPADDPAIQNFQDELVKKNSTPLSKGKTGLQAAREQAARLLKRLGDPLASRLLKLGEEGLVKTSARNLSVWIHGFEAVCVGDPEPLREVYGKLADLLQEDDPTAPERLRLARWLDFTTAAPQQPSL